MRRAASRESNGRMTGCVKGILFEVVAIIHRWVHGGAGTRPPRSDRRSLNVRREVHLAATGFTGRNLHVQIRCCARSFLGDSKKGFRGPFPHYVSSTSSTEQRANRTPFCIPKNQGGVCRLVRSLRQRLGTCSGSVITPSMQRDTTSSAVDDLLRGACPCTATDRDQAGEFSAASPDDAPEEAMPIAESVARAASNSLTSLVSAPAGLAARGAHRATRGGRASGAMDQSGAPPRPRLRLRSHFSS